MRRDDVPVVLLDEELRPAGQMPKSQVHHATTPLHLAFSCYVLDDRERLLLTRRAVTKKTFPGVWTNTCCGHPLPGEAIEEAARRRLHEELGLELRDAEIVLPDFRYQAMAADGVLENEFCPTLIARAAGEIQPDPGEVAEFRWVSWTDVMKLAILAPWSLSPWAARQIPQIAAVLRQTRD